MKSALILHAWLNGPDKHWYPWLKTELKKRGYTVYLPIIPTMELTYPKLKTQMDFLEKTILLDHVEVVIGHSLGSVLALRLAEKHSFSKLILVAGWDFDDLYPQHKHFWPSKINHTMIKKRVKNIYCITSNNDPYMTAFEVEEMSKRLNGKYILVKGAGHFTESNGITRIPQILPYL